MEEGHLNLAMMKYERHFKVILIVIWRLDSK